MDKLTDKMKALRGLVLKNGNMLYDVIRWATPKHRKKMSEIYHCKWQILLQDGVRLESALLALSFSSHEIFWRLEKALQNIQLAIGCIKRSPIKNLIKNREELRYLSDKVSEFQSLLAEQRRNKLFSDDDWNKAFELSSRIDSFHENESIVPSLMSIYCDFENRCNRGEAKISLDNYQTFVLETILKEVELYHFHHEKALNDYTELMNLFY